MKKSLGYLVLIAAALTSTASFATTFAEREAARAALTVYNAMSSRLLPALREGNLEHTCQAVRALGMAHDVFMIEELGRVIRSTEDGEASYRLFTIDSSNEAVGILREYCRDRASYVNAYMAAKTIYRDIAPMAVEFAPFTKAVNTLSAFEAARFE